MELPNIKQIWPEWRLVGLLREGTYANSYLAESRLDGEPVYSSVKIIQMPKNVDAINEVMLRGVSEEKLKAYFDKFRDALKWEMKLFKTNASPHIIQIDDMQVIDNVDYPGWTAYIRTGLFTPLLTYFKRVEPGPHESLRLGQEMCKALIVCAKTGMIHGDVNPRNIYVMDNGNFVITDFGVRRCLEPAGEVLFEEPSHEYDAPEVIKNKKYSEQSDVYSLGKLMAFTMNGGAKPAQGDLESIEGADTKLINIIYKAMSEEPEKRYQNAASMLAELNTIKLPEERFARRAAAAAAAKETVQQNKEIAEAEEAAEAAAAREETIETLKREYVQPIADFREKIKGRMKSKNTETKSDEGSNDSAVSSDTQEEKKGIGAKLRKMIGKGKKQ